MMADTTTRMRITKANKLYNAILPGRYMLRTGTSYVSCGVRFPAASNQSNLPSAVHRGTASGLSGERKGGTMFYRFKTCPRCDGDRFVGDGPPWELCPKCGGDGCVLDVPDKLIEDIIRE